jgi:hypothetical protein
VEADRAAGRTENWNEQEERAGREPQNKPERIEVSSKQGNQVTDNAYIGDFLYERVHPPFRNKELVFPELDSKVASLQACGYISDNRLLTRCHDGNKPLIAHNAQPFPRTWCGKVIGPNSVERFDEPCHEPVRLFPMNNSRVSPEGMPPVVITSSKGSTNLEDVQCNIPCRQEVGTHGTKWFIEGMDWTITHSSIENNAFRKEEYFSTPSFMSSVPQSTFSFDSYNLSVLALAYDETLPSASYLVDSRCHSPSRRNRWVDALRKYYPVAHYGSCDHDADLPEGMSLSKRDDRVNLHSKHRFSLAFEATNEKDHITELIWDAFQSGSLPVVLGPNNIESHFPINSFINAGRFKHWDQLGEYVKQVGENKTLWESYHEWRKDPDALQSFQQRYEFTRIDPTCRMCRWAYAKQYGMGWDHIKQVVQEPVLPRSLCVDSETSLLVSPFHESYVTKKSDSSYTVATRAEGSTTSCDDHYDALRGVFDPVERSIEAHDGVTDLIFHKMNRPKEAGDSILRLEFGVKNANGTYFSNPHSLVSTVRGPLYSSMAIQDERSKVTVLANWETEMLGTSQGTIEILLHGTDKGDLHQDEQRRLRVIMDDMSYLHDKMTEYFPSSFAKLMIKDFVDPLQVFYAEKPR